MAERGPRSLQSARPVARLGTNPGDTSAHHRRLIDMPDLRSQPLPPDSVGLLEGLMTTRAIRRYHDEPVPAAALRAILFAATRAPSGSNRQPFRFIVLTDGPKAAAAKRLISASAARIWDAKK